MKMTPFFDSLATLASVVFLAYGSYSVTGCGGAGSAYGANPAGPSTSSSTTVGATVTLTANGVSDATPRVALGAKVRFVNNDIRPHEILTTPHGVHTDCPALNELDLLQPGQSKDSGALTVKRGCGFHDHMNPDDQRFRGQVLVGLDTSDPTPPDPNY